MPRTRSKLKTDPNCANFLQIGNVQILIANSELKAQIAEVMKQECDASDGLRWPFPKQGIVGHDVVDIEDGPGCEECDVDRIENRVMKAVLGVGLPFVAEATDGYGRHDFRMTITDSEIIEGHGCFWFRLRGYHLYSDGRIMQLWRHSAIGRDTRRLLIRDLAGKWNEAWLTPLIEEARFDGMLLRWDGKFITRLDGSVVREAAL
jgi:hypothetical protein